LPTPEQLWGDVVAATRLLDARIAEARTGRTDRSQLRLLLEIHDTLWTRSSTLLSFRRFDLLLPVRELWQYIFARRRPTVPSAGSTKDPTDKHIVCRAWPGPRQRTKLCAFLGRLAPSAWNIGWRAVWLITLGYWDTNPSRACVGAVRRKILSAVLPTCVDTWLAGLHRPGDGPPSEERAVAVGLRDLCGDVAPHPDSFRALDKLWTDDATADAGFGVEDTDQVVAVALLRAEAYMLRVIPSTSDWFLPRRRWSGHAPKPWVGLHRALVSVCLWRPPTKAALDAIDTALKTVQRPFDPFRGMASFVTAYRGRQRSVLKALGGTAAAPFDPDEKGDGALWPGGVAPGVLDPSSALLAVKGATLMQEAVVHSAFATACVRPSSSPWDDLSASDICAPILWSTTSEILRANGIDPGADTVQRALDWVFVSLSDVSEIAKPPRGKRIFATPRKGAPSPTASPSDERAFWCLFEAFSLLRSTLDFSAFRLSAPTTRWQDLAVDRHCGALRTPRCTWLVPCTRCKDVHTSVVRTLKPPKKKKNKKKHCTVSMDDLYERHPEGFFRLGCSAYTGDWVCVGHDDGTPGVIYPLDLLGHFVTLDGVTTYTVCVCCGRCMVADIPRHGYTPRAAICKRFCSSPAK
jgi:hypothetical protein